MKTWTSNKYKGRWNLLEDFYNFNEKIKMNVIHWYNSRTIWFNVMVTVIGVATSLQGISTFDKYAQVLGLVTVVGNVILRTWFTSSTIATPSNPVQ